MEQIEKKSILLVEDEEKLARFVELELTHEGYNVEKSGNGREALELGEGSSGDPSYGQGRRDG